MKAKGEIEALKTLTDFRKQAFSNAPRAGLLLGPPTALSCLPAVQQKVGKELVPHMRGSVSERLDPLAQWETRDRNYPLPTVEPHGMSRDGSAARSWDDPRVPQAPGTALSPPRVCAAPQFAPHYANGKAFSWSRPGERACFPWGLLSNCSKPI